jgi:hypothetical protein
MNLYPWLIVGCLVLAVIGAWDCAKCRHRMGLGQRRRSTDK